MEALNRSLFMQERQYKVRIDSAQHELSKIKQRIVFISSLRFIFFFSGVATLWLFYPLGVVSGGLFLLIVAIFLRLLVLHNHLFYKKEWQETTIKVNEMEQQALAYNFSAFPDGKEFIKSSHPYTFDLDVFGDRSLFQSLNRTTTWFGCQALAKVLIEPPTDKLIIEQRQETIKELTGHFKFREQIRVEGLLKQSQKNDCEDLKKWATTPTRFSKNSFFRLLIWLIPIVNLFLISLSLMGLTPWSFWGYAFVCFVIITFTAQKQITLLQSDYGKKQVILAKYAKLLKRFEGLKAKSQQLQTMQQCLDIEGLKASARLQQFSSALNNLDQRNNILVSVILDGLFCWQIRTVIRIEKWKHQNATYLLPWLNTLGELESLCSLATFAYNHPETHYPLIVSQPFQFMGKALRHPLMPLNDCITNSVKIPASPYFVIVTGANMAGKSTYLRTIGVNYLLACTGAPICGEEVSIYPAPLITSLRTSDSLADGESYFFAELKRMKQILDRLQKGESLFILLDEILRGTNSKDKQKGSFAFISQLIQLHANGIIATHDTQLGKLVEDFPHQISNYRFEADICDNELIFSYKMREGVASNMNACFLMKKMGIKMIE
ncbi:MAG: hypothetical protein RR280_00800 [Bacteroidaceae bacterium]